MTTTRHANVQLSNYSYQNIVAAVLCHYTLDFPDDREALIFGELPFYLNSKPQKVKFKTGWTTLGADQWHLVFMTEDLTIYSNAKTTQEKYMSDAVKGIRQALKVAPLKGNWMEHILPDILSALSNAKELREALESLNKAASGGGSASSPEDLAEALLKAALDEIKEEWDAANWKPKTKAEKLLYLTGLAKAFETQDYHGDGFKQHILRPSDDDHSVAVIIERSEIVFRSPSGESCTGFKKLM